MGNNNLEEKNVSMPEKIGGVIFGIWFVASIIAGFVAREIGTDAVMLVVGQFFCRDSSCHNSKDSYSDD